MAEPVCLSRIDTMPILASSPEFSPDRVTVFDWDDTLCPSTALKSMGFNIEMPYYGITKEITEMCDTVAPHTAALILRAKEYGKVVIVTNATKDWVEMCVEQLMPSIRDVVLKVPIISAANLYGYTYYNKPMIWKNLTFKTALIETAFGSSRNPSTKRTVLSIGDGEAEREALHNLRYSFGNMVTKSLKFKEQPSPVVLIQQLQQTLEAIDMLMTHPGNLDLMWSTEPIKPPTPPSPSPLPPSPETTSPPRSVCPIERARAMPRIKSAFQFDWDEMYKDGRTESFFKAPVSEECALEPKLA